MWISHLYNSTSSCLFGSDQPESEGYVTAAFANFTAALIGTLTAKVLHKACSSMGNNAQLNNRNLTVTSDTTRENANSGPKSLDFSNNKFTVTPDVCGCPSLERLDLSLNDLTTPPNLDQNPKLHTLKMNHNSFRTPPNLSQNPNLSVLLLSENQLISPPDVSGNPDLELLYLNKNQINKCPNVENNKELVFLDLSYNELRELDDSILSLPSNCKVQVWGNSFTPAYIQEFLEKLLEHQLTYRGEGPTVYFG